MVKNLSYVPTRVADTGILGKIAWKFMPEPMYVIIYPDWAKTLQMSIRGL